jgi:membrane protein YdbS with pleckstrin-like domain
MFEDKIRKNLKVDEELILIVRKYPLVFLMPTIICAFLIIAPFFFLYPLWHWGSWGVAIFFVVLGLGIFLGLRVLVVYSLNVFVLTNQRIIDIDQVGFFDRTVSETTYDKIQDVSFRVKGIAQTIWHYGSVIVQTAGNQANIELHGVKDPQRIQHLITEIQKDSSNNNETNDTV